MEEVLQHVSEVTHPQKSPRALLLGEAHLPNSEWGFPLSGPAAGSQARELIHAWLLRAGRQGAGLRAATSILFPLEEAAEPDGPESW